MSCGSRGPQATPVLPGNVRLSREHTLPLPGTREENLSTLEPGPHPAFVPLPPRALHGDPTATLPPPGPPPTPRPSPPLSASGPLPCPLPAWRMCVCRGVGATRQAPALPGGTKPCPALPGLTADLSQPPACQSPAPGTPCSWSCGFFSAHPAPSKSVSSRSGRKILEREELGAFRRLVTGSAGSTERLAWGLAHPRTRPRWGVLPVLPVTGRVTS